MLKRKILVKFAALSIMLSCLGFALAASPEKVSAVQYCERCYDVGGQVKFCTWTAPPLTFCPPHSNPEAPPPPNASCGFVEQCPVYWPGH